MLMDNLVSVINNKPGLYEPIEKKAELDEKFFKKLLLLKTTPEYKNRPGDFFKHEFSDKLIIIDKIDELLYILQVINMIRVSYWSLWSSWSS